MVSSNTPGEHAQVQTPVRRGGTSHGPFLRCPSLWILRPTAVREQAAPRYLLFHPAFHLPGLRPPRARRSSARTLNRTWKAPAAKPWTTPPGGGAARRNSSSLFIIAVSQPRTPLPKPATEAQSSDLTVPALGTHGTTLRLHPKFLIPSASALCKRKGCGPGRPQGRGTAEGHCVPPSPPPLAHTPWTHHSSAQLSVHTHQA